MVIQKYKVKVLNGHRITIPKDVRERLGIHVGDELELIVEGGKIILKLSDEDPVFMLLGLAEGAPTEELGDELFLKELKKKKVSK